MGLPQSLVVVDFVVANIGIVLQDFINHKVEQAHLFLGVRKIVGVDSSVQPKTIGLAFQLRFAYELVAALDGGAFSGTGIHALAVEEFVETGGDREVAVGAVCWLAFILKDNKPLLALQTNAVERIDK